MGQTKFLIDISGNIDTKVSATVDIDGEIPDIAAAVCQLFDQQPQFYELLKHILKVYEISNQFMQDANLNTKTNE